METALDIVSWVLLVTGSVFSMIGISRRPKAGLLCYGSLKRYAPALASWKGRS